MTTAETTADLDAVSCTALLSAALRARQSGCPDRLYADPYARMLCGTEGPALLAEVARISHPGREVRFARAGEQPTTFDLTAIRTRYLDDWLAATLTETGYDQVVLPAAGMDTRAYRLRWPHPVQVFEVDRPAVLDHKHDRLAAHRTARHATRRPVEADLQTDGWIPALVAAGFDPTRPVVWLIEGLLQYLAEPEVHDLLAGVARCSVPGSRLAADVVNRAMLTDAGTSSLMRLFEDRGSPYLFGCDDPDRLLAAHGFAATCVQPGQSGANYLNWPRPPAGPGGSYVHGRRNPRD